jgi:hypothetical protein
MWGREAGEKGYSFFEIKKGRRHSNLRSRVFHYREVSFVLREIHYAERILRGAARLEVEGRGRREAGGWEGGEGGKKEGGLHGRRPGAEEER